MAIRRVATLLTLALAVGCHRETPMERAARTFREQREVRIAGALLESGRFRIMSDAEMVRANQKDGLGLGARAEKTELHVGEPLKLHLAYEDLAAHGPVSATTCQGFSIADEDETTDVTTSVSTSFACPENDRLRDHHVALRPGELKTAEVSTGETKLTFDHPGRYIVMVGWQTFRPRDGLFLRDDGYSVMGSNQVLITVR